MKVQIMNTQTGAAQFVSSPELEPVLRYADRLCLGTRYRKATFGELDPQIVEPRNFGELTLDQVEDGSYVA